MCEGSKTECKDWEKKIGKRKREPGVLSSTPNEQIVIVYWNSTRKRAPGVQI